MAGREKAPAHDATSNGLSCMNIVKDSGGKAGAGSAGERPRSCVVAHFVSFGVGRSGAVPCVEAGCLPLFHRE